MLILGENDRVVRIHQSEKMHSELKPSKKPVKFVTLKDENHHLETRTGRAKALEEIMLFLDSHIGATEQ